MENVEGKYEYIEHTADVKFKAYGGDLGEAFENAAVAMFKIMFSGDVKGEIKKKIVVEGADNESLLYNFLEELLYLLDTEDFFLSSCQVKISGKDLEAELVGDNAKDYEANLDVKAITYNEMFVKKEKSKWVVQVVVDV
jgi:SHS2 domain-containing protein